MPWIVQFMIAFGEWLKSTRLAELSVWIAGTRVSTAVNQNAWITPTLQSIHIAAIAAAFGAALMINLRLLRVAGRDHTLSEVEARYTPWVWWGLLALSATGLALVLAEPARELLNPGFWSKVVLIGVVAGATLWFQRSVRRGDARWIGDEGGVAVRAGAAALIAVWCAIMILGRWIAYIGI